MPWRYVLEEPAVSVEQLRCAHCEKVEAMVRHKVTAYPVNEPNGVPTPTGEVLLCPSCKEMSRPASRFARGLGLFLMVPITAVLLYGFARGMWLSYDLVTGAEKFALSKLVLALTLIPFGGFLSFRSLRIVVRALTPGWLLPLKDLRK